MLILSYIEDIACPTVSSWFVRPQITFHILWSQRYKNFADTFSFLLDRESINCTGISKGTVRMHHPDIILFWDFFFCSSLALSFPHFCTAVETELCLLTFSFLLSGFCAIALVHMVTYDAIHSSSYMKSLHRESLILRL